MRAPINIELGPLVNQHQWPLRIIAAALVAITALQALILWVLLRQ